MYLPVGDCLGIFALCGFDMKCTYFTSILLLLRTIIQPDIALYTHDSYPSSSGVSVAVR